MKTEKRRVLVVEDERSLLRAFARILFRFNVTACASVTEARACLATCRFDAVVCDVQLPDGDGVQFFAELRRVAPEQAARFVFTSAAVDDPGVRGRLEETGLPFLRKPFAVASFVEIVTCIAEGGQARRTSSARWVAAAPA